MYFGIIRSFIAGGIAACGAVTATHPFETIKIRYLILVIKREDEADPESEQIAATRRIASQERYAATLQRRFSRSRRDLEE